jgi:hypothetical protein
MIKDRFTKNPKSTTANRIMKSLTSFSTLRIHQENIQVLPNSLTRIEPQQIFNKSHQQGPCITYLFDQVIIVIGEGLRSGSCKLSFMPKIMEKGAVSNGTWC